MTITNYAIKDHIGSVEDIALVYALANEMAEADGFVADNRDPACNCYNMKQFCYMVNPNTRNVEGVKWAMRKTKNPQIVYLICHDEDDSKVQFVKDMWEERNIEVKLVVEPETATYSFGDMELSIARRTAMIWGDALGWSFSAPVVRDTKATYLCPENWVKRGDHEAMLNIPGMTPRGITKPLTKSEHYLNATHTIASEEEVKAFREHYVALARLAGSIENMEQFLEVGWKICPECHRPVKESAGACTWCNHEFEAIEEARYFDEDECFDGMNHAFDADREYIARVEAETTVADFTPMYKRTPIFVKEHVRKNEPKRFVHTLTKRQAEQYMVLFHEPAEEPEDF